ncbi:MAG: Site-specific tyrosine recombinase XerC [uncultured Clostridium sp.]
MAQKRRKRKNKIKLINYICPGCDSIWENKATLQRIRCPFCNEIIKWGKKKEEAWPIPDEKYDLFKKILVESSREKERKRNLVLFQLGIATGYRLGDLVELKIGDILTAIEKGKFCIDENKKYKAWQTNEWKKESERLKGKKVKSKNPPRPREAMIRPNLKAILIEYCKGKKRSEYAFKSSTRSEKHIEAGTFSKKLTEISKDKRLNLTHITGHSLRKTYATRMYESTGNVEYVKDALGHADVRTTYLYLRLGKKEIEKGTEYIDQKL